MTEHPQRKTDHLLKGRVSIPHTRYFITLCTKDRQPGLTKSVPVAAILNTWRRQHGDRDYVFHCGTVMPDHIHWLCTLGERLTLAQIISKFKTHTSVPQAWQRNYYDHRLRADDAKEPFSKYIFLNPYRKKLLDTDQEWPWWKLNRNERPEFITHLINGKYPPPEWLNQSNPLQEIIEKDRTDNEAPKKHNP